MQLSFLVLLCALLVRTDTFHHLIHHFGSDTDTLLSTMPPGHHPVGPGVLDGRFPGNMAPSELTFKSSPFPLM